MKKSGLQDIKKRNRQVIMQSILEKGALSRIEIAQQTQLSPSTVTGLVNELIEDGILTESGATASTGGRKRIELEINRDYGDICIAQIGRQGATLHLFDMALNECAMLSLADHYITGNDLLIAITSAVFEQYGVEEIRRKKLLGFGLLFQEDFQASECNVIYSTSLSSASISLREALVTQFRTPVLEDYSGSYSLSTATEQHEAKKSNSAHITIGKNIMASITLKGRTLELKGGRSTDITPLLHSIGNNVPQLEMLKNLCTKELPVMEKSLANPQSSLLTAFSHQLSSLIVLLCTLFPLDTIFLSGNVTNASGFAHLVKDLVTEQMEPEPAPDIQLFDLNSQPVANLLANKIRRKVLSVG